MIELNKYKEAQSYSYNYALEEIRNGKKKTHWMWYIFPQIIGLGRSETSAHYAIKSQEEAKAYLEDELLGKRLIEISTELLNQPTNDPKMIFGDIDSLKLKSSMTLFSLADEKNTTFKKVLDKYYEGKKDEKTIEIWNDLKEKSKHLEGSN